MSYMIEHDNFMVVVNDKTSRSCIKGNINDIREQTSKYTWFGWRNSTVTQQIFFLASFMVATITSSQLFKNGI